MSDGTQLNAGTGGDLISTDDLGGGVKVQRTKVQYGVDGAAADVTPANPLPVRSSADGTNPVDQTHPLFARLSDGTNALGAAAAPLHVRPSADGTNPVAAANPLAVRGGDGTTQAVYTTAGEALAVPKRPSTATISRVANSATSVQLLAANTARLGIKICNEDTAALLYVKYGTTASATSYTVLLLPGDFYEEKDGYTGKIDAIASVATGNAQLTELT